MDIERSFIIFIFIVLVFIALYILRYSDNLSEISIIFSVISAIFIGYLFNVREFFVPENEVISSDDIEPHVNVNTDNLEMNKYGNISTTDIDMTTQEMPNMDFDSSYIDNSDVIEMAITRGTSLFHPDGQGFSPLKGVAETPSVFSEYNIPLTGQQNVDELLARKQQQRAAINKRALDGRVRATRALYNKYFTEELDENEKRVWWSSESADIETDWSPY
jgi:hypothetical protein